MKKLTWTWKKVIALVGAAIGIGTLVSCYGVVNPERYDFESNYDQYGEESQNEEPAENADDVEENQQSDVE